MGLPLVGQDFGDIKPSVFELRINDHIGNINPFKYGLEMEDFNSIDPNAYFITSGDAIEKAKVLEKDIWKLAGELRKYSCTLLAKERKVSIVKARSLYKKGKRPIKPQGFSDYESAVWKAAGQTRKMLNKLKIAKGIDCFLETEWENHKLLCIPKNPRR